MATIWPSAVQNLRAAAEKLDAAEVLVTQAGDLLRESSLVALSAALTTPWQELLRVEQVALQAATLAEAER